MFNNTPLALLSCLPPNKLFVFCLVSSYFQESKSLIPVEDKNKVHDVPSPVILKVVLILNLSGVPLKQERLVQVFSHNKIVS